MTAYRQRGCELKGKRVCKQRGCSKRSVRPQRSPQTSRRTTAAGRATDSVLRAASTRSRRAAHRSGAALAGQRSVPCALHCLKVGDPTGDARGLYNQSRWHGAQACALLRYSEQTLVVGQSVMTSSSQSSLCENVLKKYGPVRTFVFPWRADLSTQLVSERIRDRSVVRRHACSLGRRRVEELGACASAICTVKSRCLESDDDTQVDSVFPVHFVREGLCAEHPAAQELEQVECILDASYFG
jgi:hypothetical protein